MVSGGHCVTIRPGDTASGVAVRLAGLPDARHQPWFQIVDTRTNVVVPKSEYDVIQPGWHACVRAQTNSFAGTPVAQISSIVHSGWQPDVAPRAFSDSAVAFMLVALVIAAALLWQAIERYLTERERTIDVMRRFGERFVHEFERPLLDAQAGARPIRSRLKANPDRRRLEILLAPVAGKRYPNLSDHRDNVAYDVGRVLRALRDRSFVSVPPYADGAWVVLSFHYHQRPEQAGGS